MWEQHEPLRDEGARGVRDLEGPDSIEGRKWGEGNVSIVLDPERSAWLYALALGDTSVTSLGGGLFRHVFGFAGELLATLEVYLANNCNMNATAQSIHAHRHTVAYRLERVKELSGLDPLRSEDRERLGLGLKAYRIIAPSLPR
jgi:hypothetical protein